MPDQNSVECEHLTGNICKPATWGIAKEAREESCSNEQKNLCCYLCAHRSSCEISCNWLDKLEKAVLRKNHESANVNQEIAKTEGRIARLSSLYAEGKIGEQSYVSTARTLEDGLDRLRKIGEKPDAQPSSSETHVDKPEEAETTLIEKPTALWYLVPFFFGIIGGIVGYVGVKDEDQKMAADLLIFGIFWTIILVFIYWGIVSLLFSRILR